MAGSEGWVSQIFRFFGDKGSAWWETGGIARSSPATVVNNDVTSHCTNPLDPVFSPVFGICSGVRYCHVCTSDLSGKNRSLARFLLFSWGQYS